MPGKIIVVDNSPTVCRFIANILIRSNYEVLTATGVDSCLKLLRDHSSVDAILAGLDLDGKTPSDMFVDLASFGEALPTVLMFSRSVDGNFCDWILRSNFAGCLQKPINEAALIRTMARAVALGGGARRTRENKLSDDESFRFSI